MKKINMIIFLNIVILFGCQNHDDIEIEPEKPEVIILVTNNIRKTIHVSETISPEIRISELENKMNIADDNLDQMLNSFDDYVEGLELINTDEEAEAKAAEIFEKIKDREEIKKFALESARYVSERTKGANLVAYYLFEKLFSSANDLKEKEQLCFNLVKESGFLRKTDDNIKWAEYGMENSEVRSMTYAISIDHMALSLEANKDYERALEYTLKQAELYKGIPVQVNVARCYHNLGDNEKALSIISDTLEIENMDPRERSSLERLAKKYKLLLK